MGRMLAGVHCNALKAARMAAGGVVLVPPATSRGRAGAALGAALGDELALGDAVGDAVADAVGDAVADAVGEPAASSALDNGAGATDTLLCGTPVRLGAADGRTVGVGLGVGWVLLVTGVEAGVEAGGVAGVDTPAAV
ncbi:MAG: hypothetical protein ACYDB7_03645 [Mycobacteriales bacterium]